MTAPVAIVLAMQMALGGVGHPLWSVAGPTADQNQDKARRLYDEGKKAYRLGNFESAVGKWEEAYALADTPLLLYNIGLAYKGWYGISNELGHLRKSRAVLENFLMEVRANSEIGDPKEAEARIAEVDDLIENHKESAAQPTTTPTPPRDPGPTGKDPGKNLRIGGAVAMGVGGAILVSGVIAGGVFAWRSGQKKNDLDAARNASMGNVMDPPCPTETTGECEDLINDGNRLNNLSVVSFAVMGGIGVVGLVSGAILFAFGNRRTRSWERGGASAQLRPTFGPRNAGFVLSGRF